jgi:hypothetical protein
MNITQAKKELIKAIENITPELVQRYEEINTESTDLLEILNKLPEHLKTATYYGFISSMLLQKIDEAKTEEIIRIVQKKQRNNIDFNQN